MHIPAKVHLIGHVKRVRPLVVGKAESIAKSSVNRGIGRTLSVGCNEGIPFSLADDTGGIGAKASTS